MAGLRPWKEPSPASTNQGQSWAGAQLRESGIAVRIRRAVAALEPNLVRSVPFRPFDEKLRVERNPSLRACVELHHPTLDSLRVELLVDRPIERIGEVDALA